MKRLALYALMLLALSGCAGVLDYCPDGLTDNPPGSSAPSPRI